MQRRSNKKALVAAAGFAVCLGVAVYVAVSHTGRPAVLNAASQPVSKGFPPALLNPWPLELWAEYRPLVPCPRDAL